MFSFFFITGLKVFNFVEKRTMFVLACILLKLDFIIKDLLSVSILTIVEILNDSLVFCYTYKRSFCRFIVRTIYSAFKNSDSFV